MTKDTDSTSPLRASLFRGVPPFINYIPKSGVHVGGLSLQPGPQYWDEDKNWDQDQLWRFTIAIENWIEDVVKEIEKIGFGGKNLRKWEGGSNTDLPMIAKPKSRRLQNQIEIRPAFGQRPDDAKRFLDWHSGVKLCHFPRLHQISKKDILGQNFFLMRRKFGQEEFGCHPITYVLPDDKANLVEHMSRSSDQDLWIVKPPHTNNGTGVYVIKKAEEIPKSPVCVQEYIRNPLLINGFKFDIRVYVLLTSVAPLRIYMYDDGLVRIATEKYTEDLDSIGDCCIHVCNYAVNCKNTEKFVHNTEPDSVNGNKWRLKCLWPFLMKEYGLSEDDIESIRSEIKDVVIKTILSAHTDARKEFLELSEQNVYNSYRLLGYDLLIDADLKVHLIEVNSKPHLSGDILDRTVNRPLLHELLRIVGYHIPARLEKYKDIIIKCFNLPQETKIGPVTYESGLYKRRNGLEDMYKQEKYFETDFDQESYINTILTDLTPGDVRQLVKLEEERGQLQHFLRLMPSSESQKYFRFMEGVSYYDKLLHAYEVTYADNREKGIDRIRSLCDNNRHL